MTPFRATKGTIFEGGFRVPIICRWPGHVKPGTVENGIFSGLDWYPSLLAAARNPNIKDQLLKGVTLGDRTYKNHLDGSNQLDRLAVRFRAKRGFGPREDRNRVSSHAGACLIQSGQRQAKNPGGDQGT